MLTFTKIMRYIEDVVAIASMRIDSLLKLRAQKRCSLVPRFFCEHILSDLYRAGYERDTVRCAGSRAPVCQPSHIPALFASLTERILGTHQIKREVHYV